MTLDARTQDYGQRLAQLIRCETVSHDHQTDKRKFYVFHDLLMYGMNLPEALGLFGARLLLSLPVGALTWLLVRSIYRRFAEESQ